MAIDQCRLDNDGVICGNQRISLRELHAEGAKVDHRFSVSRRAYLSPRTIAFNVQGVRLAVHRVTGEIRVLHSVHAADIGRPINPMQCRGQLDGAVAMGYGWALVENMVHDDEGHMVNPQLRNCRVPTFADTPHTDIFFADTIDLIGPLGAKSQGECGINPVAPAVSNALANATGVRFAHLPFTPDRLFAQLLPQERADRQHRHPDHAFGRRAPRTSRAGRARPATSISSFPGFVEQRLMPPNPPLQVDWVILQRFDSHGGCASAGWPRPSARPASRARRRCWSAATTCTSCATMRGRRKPAPVSAVISTRVKPGKEAEYRAWERKIAAAQSKAPGLQGYRFEPPVPGVQEDYVAILRFDSETNLQAWLRFARSESSCSTKPRRSPRNSTPEWRKPASSNGSATPRRGAPAPAVWKMDMIVLLTALPDRVPVGPGVGTPILTGVLSRISRLHCSLATRSASS